MTIIRSVIYLSWLALVAAGCCSSDKSQTSDTAKPEAQEVRVQSTGGKPTTVKPNVTEIEARINSITLVDSIHYKLSISIIAVKPAEGMESLAEAGQEVVVSPLYTTGKNGGIDIMSERNRSLRSLRDLQTGEMIKGKISLAQSGEWILVEVQGR
ncbi:MAG: hypothetical protein HY707_14770 [Ignavibacteriae bacterium]|nr:hypothetical protein [Ignavibacteriota bacterium]